MSVSLSDIKNLMAASDIDDIVVDVSGNDSAVVSVSCVDDGGTVFSQNLAAVDRKVIVHDAGDLLLAYMRRKGYAAAGFTIWTESKIAEFMCVAVDRLIPDASEFLVRNPLLSSPVSLIGDHAKAWFHYVNMAGEGDAVTVAMRVDYMTDDGSVEYVAMSDVETGPTVRSVVVDVDAILQKVRSLKKDAVRLLKVTVMAKCAHMPQFVTSEYFIDHDPRLFGFRFINAFGLEELVFFRGVVSQVSASDCSEAFVGHMRVAYDVEASSSFSVEARNIPLSESERISQFATSCEIYELSTERQVCIDSPKAEISDDDSSLNTFKFSYRYVDDRPLMIVR